MIQTIFTAATALSTIFAIILLCLPIQYGAQAAPLSTSTAGETNDGPPHQAQTSVQILVLGDLGRSPRMQYHALSIAKHGGSVQLIGYLDTEPLSELQSLQNVKIVPLSASPSAFQTSNRILFLAFAPLKVLYQICNLWWVLGYQTVPSKWLLVQNPPSIPTLLIAMIACFLRHTRLVIDWHNFGHSLLALKLGPQHPFVRISQRYEQLLAQSAYAHFAVTDVMKNVLLTDYVPKAPVLTLHDRPADLFRPLSDEARMTFLSRCSLTSSQCTNILNQKTRLLVSPTSWTPDEDFSVLLKSLCEYSARATSFAPQLPELLVIITGKGPQKSYYTQRVKELKERGELEMVTITPAWLSFEDYALLLGSADLGISLHTSSSGVDLPMKVVDMFGTGLPVLGFDNFKAWPELVTDGFNGRGFATAEQMTEILEQLFEPGEPQLAILKRGAFQESTKRWNNEWDSVAGHLFGLAR